MSERKTAEIKFRCTPTFKARVQAAAQAADLSMSEYIERAVEVQERPNTVTVVPLVDGSRVFVEKQGCPNAGRPCNCTGQCQRPVGAPEPRADWMQATDVTFAPPRPSRNGPVLMTPPSGNVLDSGGCTCRPWEFCTHKANA